MDIEGYDFPEDLYYDNDHFWLRPEGELLVMGMDSFGQHLAGDIVFIQLPAEGKKLVAGEVFAKMESGKWMGKIKASVSGSIAEINEELEMDPALINEDPYGQGWMFKIAPDDLSQLATLRQGTEALLPWIKEEVKKFEQN